MNERYFTLQTRSWLIAIILVFGAGSLWEYYHTRRGSFDLLVAGWDALKLWFVAAVALHLVNVVAIAIYLAIFSDESMINEMVVEMKRHHLPPRKTGDPPGIDYLEAIAYDKDADVEDRVNAAVFYNTYKPRGSSTFLFGSAALRRALKKAVRQYAEERGTA